MSKDFISENPVKYSKRNTCNVNISHIPLGSNFPVRIQSMANTPTGDITGSVEQCIRIINAGADFVRFTVPSLVDVEAFAAIKEKLTDRGYHTPLIADVHFNPDIALKVADCADKVRINPGNFTDKEKFKLLLEKCRQRNVALRVGVNHGSLSEKIMNDYGDTPAGMAASAMEYLRICRDQHFDQVVVSMKASNVRVMIYATRLIASMMQKEGMEFPLHLGVTEAGEGEDGRIKSAVGIGTLLAEGLGDTIRVSLTEEPEAEIPVAKKLVEMAGVIGREGERERGREGERERGSEGARERRSEGARERGSEGARERRSEGARERGSEGFEFLKRKSRIAGNIGGDLVPVVWGFDDLDKGLHLINSVSQEITDEFIRELSADRKAVLVYEPGSTNIPSELKQLRYRLENMKCDVPVIFRLNLNETVAEDFMLRSAVCLGGAFIDGFGDGIWLANDYPLAPEIITGTALGILQACRARMSKTEYISCPSCGRTQFNLMEALARIKKATSHLKGLKIGVMGCIVNGPGEMADADYGYVGAGKGKITLYKAREVVKRGIPEDEAVQELVNLIRENGDWVEPEGGSDE